MRLEASTLPPVLTSTSDTTPPQHSSTAVTAGFPSKLPPPPEWVIPPVLWKNALLQEFQQLREYCARWLERLPALVEAGEVSIPLIPKRRNAVAWFKLCFGEGVAIPRAVLKQHRAKDEAKDASKKLVYAPHGRPPLLDFVLHIDHGTVEHLLKDHIYSVEEKSALQTHRALWLFALLTRLEKPLTGDMAADLTRLTRVCRIKRDAISVEESKDKTEEIAALNIVIVICEEHFRQVA